jgi:hypothetical protein
MSGNSIKIVWNGNFPYELCVATSEVYKWLRIVCTFLQGSKLEVLKFSPMNLQITSKMKHIVSAIATM